MITIPISDVHLTTILESVRLSNLHWSILHIWATSKENSELDIFALENKTKTEFGFQLSWENLLSLSKQIDQINECTIVGVSSHGLLPERGLPLENLKASCDVVIEAVDSTNWEISVKDANLSRKLGQVLIRL